MKKDQKQIIVALVVTAAALATTAAFAGADTTFSGPATQLTSWLQGSMGKLFAVGSLCVGLGIGIVKQSIMSAAVGTGIALAASTGPTVMAAITNMTL